MYPLVAKVSSSLGFQQFCSSPRSQMWAPALQESSFGALDTTCLSLAGSAPTSHHILTLVSMGRSPWSPCSEDVSLLG